MPTAYALTKPKNQDAVEGKAKGWWDGLSIHPAAGLFPLISKSKQRELADDIEKHGLRDRVDLYRDETALNGSAFVSGPRGLGL